jgi:hypothetical protein
MPAAMNCSSVICASAGNAIAPIRDAKLDPWTQPLRVPGSAAKLQQTIRKLNWALGQQMDGGSLLDLVYVLALEW